MAHVVLKLLRVYAHPDVTLVFNHREGALAPVDENWWIDVLHDPRARPPRASRIEASSRNARYRLDRQGSTGVSFACRLCRWTHSAYKSDLIKAHGPDRNVIGLATDLATCDRRNGGACGAYCVG